MTSTDLLMSVWRNQGRVLNWRAWRGLSAGASATVRLHLMRELQVIDTWDPPQAWAWVHTHRALLECKAANGHQIAEETL